MWTNRKSPARRTRGFSLLAAALGLIFFLGIGDARARVVLPVFDEAALKPACENALDKAARQVAQLESVPLGKVTVANTLNAWNALQNELEDVIGPAYLMASVHPEKPVRDAADECLLKYNAFNTGLFQNEKLFQRFRKVAAPAGSAAKLRKDLTEEFEDTGVALPPDRRERVKQILQRLEELRQEFDRNVRDNKTKLVFTPEEMQGLPKPFLDKAQRDEQGNYRLGFDYPEYQPFMTNADNEAARRRYYIAFNSRGGERNIAIMNEVVRLRLEMARLHGLPSYAHLATRRKMVENPETVDAFLREVKSAVREVESRELAELRELKALRTAVKPEETTFNRWDVAYYQEKMRRARYDVNQEELRRYFPTGASVAWALLVSGHLYGIRFREAKVPVWHPDVKYYDVLDSGTGKFLGGVYLDLYPREGKYRHAAAFGTRTASRLAGRTPISVLVTNFNREGLDHHELETLLHEFGHVLHGVLSRADYNYHGGTSVVRDFVEAPSQMFEEWARRAESLGLMQKVCPACPLVDRALIERIQDARRYGSGILYSRQHLYAGYDMAMASEQPGDALETWRKMEAETPLGHVEGTLFPASFNHIIGGYAAGYYGYMWSRVLARDMLSAFGDNVMNPRVGRRFRDLVLAQGGQVPAKVLVRRFLGRPVSSKPFFDEITGKR